MRSGGPTSTISIVIATIVTPSQHITVNDGDTIPVRTIVGGETKGGRRIIPSCLHACMAPFARFRGNLMKRNPHAPFIPSGLPLFFPSCHPFPCVVVIPSVVRREADVRIDVTTGERGRGRTATGGSGSGRRVRRVFLSIRPGLIAHVAGVVVDGDNNAIPIIDADAFSLATAR